MTDLSEKSGSGGDRLPSSAKSGYTLPVFACAGAIAALQQLADRSQSSVSVNLITPAQTVDIPIEQSAKLSEISALAITRSDPGDNLDLTRNTPVWSVVSWADSRQPTQIVVEGGEGIGRLDAEQSGDRAAIYSYAQKLFQANLSALLRAEQKIKVTIILPEGKRLALRTSNAAFGVVDGLSLLGTSGISQPLSAPSQLETYRQTLREKASRYRNLVFCLGENGLDLSLKQGIEPDRRLKTANWIGPLLVEAGLLGVESILLFGYHGKLVKLAGGIFHTHHHIADARQEILTACCAEADLATTVLQQVLNSPTAEAALSYLRTLDSLKTANLLGQPASRVYQVVANRIDHRANQYIQTHSERSVAVGSVLFDRQRQIIVKSDIGQTLMP